MLASTDTSLGASVFSAAFGKMLDYFTENYVVFGGVMSLHGYAWEAHKVDTEDGWTLTAFHVTGKIDAEGNIVTREPTEPPVLV